MFSISESPLLSIESVRLLDHLIQKGMLKKLEIAGNYDPSKQKDRISDLLGLIELNFLALRVPFCRVVLADENYIRAKFPVDFNSQGYYSAEDRAIYLYPKPLAPLYTFSVVVAHEYAIYADDKMNITNGVFASKLSRFLEGTGISPEELAGSHLGASFNKNEDMDKEIFASAYCRLVTDSQTPITKGILKIAAKCSNIDLDFDGPRSSSIFGKLMLAKNSMKFSS